MAYLSFNYLVADAHSCSSGSAAQTCRQRPHLHCYSSGTQRSISVNSDLKLKPDFKRIYELKNNLYFI